MLPARQTSKVVGGGFPQSSTTLLIANSFPLDAQTWRINWRKLVDSATPPSVAEFALCVRPDPAGAVVTAKKGVVPAKLKKALKNRGQ